MTRTRKALILISVGVLMVLGTAQINNSPALPSLSDNGSTVTSASGIVLSGASGAATTISTTTTNASLFLTPNGTGNVQVGIAGAAATPALVASAGTTTGYHFPAANTWCWDAAATIRNCFLAGGMNQIDANVYGWNNTPSSAPNTAVSKLAAGYMGFGTGAQGSVAGYTKSAMTAILTSDWTCGTGGTASSCVSATTIGTLTFTLPLVATNWSFDCNLIVGQATAVTANNWSLQTATNGATNLAASYMMNTAATAVTSGALTGQASTTSSVDITGTWTLGAIGTKMPVDISGTVEGASASGTVLNFQLKAPTAADLVTIYRGSKCTLNP